MNRFIKKILNKIIINNTDLLTVDKYIEIKNSDINRILYRIDELNEKIKDNNLINNLKRPITIFSRNEIDKMISNIEKSYKYKTYSQYREDLLIKHIFNLIDVENPYYIDIGAHHPLNLSNTALLYETGSSGINIEANPILIKNFEEIRKRDINLNIGVGEQECEIFFYIIKDHYALSTFDVVQLSRLSKYGYKIENKVKIVVKNINNIIDEYVGLNSIDFISIDIEGSDLSIINKLDFKKYRPKVLCVEINDFGTLNRNVDIEIFLFKKGYSHFGDVGGGQEGRNAIFIDSKYSRVKFDDFI